MLVLGVLLSLSMLGKIPHNLVADAFFFFVLLIQYELSVYRGLGNVGREDRQVGDSDGCVLLHSGVSDGWPMVEYVVEDFFVCEKQ